MADKKSNFRKLMSSDVNVIKDPDCFKITIPPREIIERKEILDFYRELSVFVKYQKPNNLLIKGFPGSGKTVTIEYAMRELAEFEKKIDTKTVNCHDKSSLDILKVLLPESRGGNFQSLVKDFLTGLEKDTVIVLDEVDRSNKIEKLLYVLSRPTEIFPEFSKNLSLVLISNNLRWEDDLKDSIRSSLQLKPIIFNPYSENEIRRILKARIEKGFVDKGSIDSSLIDVIAKTSVKKRRADCRVAIEAVFYAAQIAESNGRKEINFNDVKQALKNAINQFDKLLVGKLRSNQLLVLYLLCSQEFKTYENLHKTFAAVIKNHQFKIDTITVPRIFYAVNYLDNLCLISKNVEVMIENNMPRKKTKVKCNVNMSIVLDELLIRDIRLSDSKNIQQNMEEDLDNPEK